MSIPAKITPTKPSGFLAAVAPLIKAVASELPQATIPILKTPLASVAQTFTTPTSPPMRPVQLSPLFSSSNTNDIASVRARIPGGGKTNITFSFAASATNTPTITIGSGSRTISHLYMKDDGIQDDLGIRVSGSSLSYSIGDSSAWVVAGILNKSIGDFFGNLWSWSGESSKHR